MLLLGITNLLMKYYCLESWNQTIIFSFINSGLIFSSEIKGLLPYIGNSNKIDRQSLACTSLLGVNVLRQTIFNGIYKVFPGETIIYNIDQKK